MPWNQKKYARINWKNRPSTATALGATNLNKIDVFCNEVDNYLITMDASKLDISTANGMLKSLTINEKSGIITATQLDGTEYTWDLNTEKIPVSFSLSEDGVLTMTTEDGTEFTANIADLIKDYVFEDSETVGFSKSFSDDAYHVTAIVKEGSIKSEHLDPDYRADIQDYMNTAQTAANDSLQYSKDSKRWAVGDAEYEGSGTDNSKFYKEQAELARDEAKKYRDEANTQARTEPMAPGILGVGMPDNITIKAESDGTIYAVKAEKGKAGVVKSDEATIYVGDNGEISARSVYYGAYDSFPAQGNINILYVDNTVDPRLAYTWDVEKNTYILTGGAGGADGSSIDIPLTLLSANWTGAEAPYSQIITVPQMREGMTPFYFFTGTSDDEQYASSLITGYNAAYAQMTWYAADKPEVDIPLVLKGIATQQLEYADNSVVVVVPADGFALDENYNRYVQEIPVEGMVSGAQGGWDIVRSRDILTPEESNFAASITDVIPMDGAVKIVCLWPPEQQYMIKLIGTYTQATEGTTLLAGMSGWFDRVEELENNSVYKYVFDVSDGTIMQGKLSRGIYLIIISYSNGAATGSVYVANSDSEGIMRITPIAEGSAAPKMSNYNNVITADRNANFIALKLN